MSAGYDNSTWGQPTPDGSGVAEAPAHDDKTRNNVIKARKASSMTRERTKWLAKGWLPRKDIAVLVGREGIGKSLGWVRFAANITTGSPDPLTGFPKRKPANVIAIVTEDTAADVVARLELAGADLDRVYFFCAAADGTGLPVFGANADDGDLLVLQTQIMEIGDVSMVVVDSWVDTVSGKLILKDGQQARLALAPWKKIAKTYDLSVLLLTHTNRLDTDHIRDLMGTTATLAQAARMILVAGCPQEERGQHVWIGPEKANGTGIGHAVKFRLGVHQVEEATDDDPGTVARLQNPVSAAASIQDLFTQWHRAKKETEKPKSKRELVEDAIRQFMAGKDSAPTNDVKAVVADMASKNIVAEVLKDLGDSRNSGPGTTWMYRLYD